MSAREFGFIGFGASDGRSANTFALPEFRCDTLSSMDPACIADQIKALDAARKAAGRIGNRHHTDYVAEVKALMRAGDNAAAIRLLLRLVEAVEAESKVAGPHWPVAPWYYEQLAMILRKAKNYRGEVEILRRYVAQHEVKTEAPYPAILARLEKAEALLLTQG